MIQRDLKSALPIACVKLKYLHFLGKACGGLEHGYTTLSIEQAGAGCSSWASCEETNISPDHTHAVEFKSDQIANA